MAPASCLLALNTAEGFLQLALGVPPEHAALEEGPPARRRSASLQGLFCAQEWRLPSQGAELLMPLVQSVLSTLKLTPGQITRIACVTGPGSFTGIRLALSSAAGLARATQASMAGLPFLPLLARNALQSGCPGLCQASSLWVATHARRDLVHLQGFAIPPLSPAAPCQPSPLGEILVLSPEKAAALITNAGGKPLVLGSGLSKNKESFSAAFARLPQGSVEPLFAGAAFDTVSAATLFGAACEAEFSSQDIAPHYVRPCDAEDSLEQIAQALGLDPSKAKAALEALQASGIPRETS